MKSLKIKRAYVLLAAVALIGTNLVPTSAATLRVPKQSFPACAVQNGITVLSPSQLRRHKARSFLCNGFHPERQFLPRAITTEFHLRPLPKSLRESSKRTTGGCLSTRENLSLTQPQSSWISRHLLEPLSSLKLVRVTIPQQRFMTSLSHKTPSVLQSIAGIQRPISHQSSLSEHALRAR